MHQVDGGSKIQEPAQEFMVAMECLFYEWYEDLGMEEGQLFGRRAASNNTMALEIVTKEGGVSCTCFCCPLLACTMAIFMAWQLRVRNTDCQTHLNNSDFMATALEICSHLQKRSLIMWDNLSFERCW